jgi:hypothetical protein
MLPRGPTEDVEERHRSLGWQIIEEIPSNVRRIKIQEGIAQACALFNSLKVIQSSEFAF